MHYCFYVFPFFVYLCPFCICSCAYDPNLCLFMCWYPHLCPFVCLCPYLCLFVCLYPSDRMLVSPSVSVHEMCLHLCLFMCLCLQLWLFIHVLLCPLVSCVCMCVCVCVCVAVDLRMVDLVTCHLLTTCSCVAIFRMFVRITGASDVANDSLPASAHVVEIRSGQGSP